jgi:SAM-dependent methyltransferase
MDASPRELDYALSNDHPHSAEHHAALAQLLDPTTTPRLIALSSWSGSRCLVVGAGGGSIAMWLADRVGPFGQVIATDLDTRHIPTHKQLRTVRHDLRGDDPLPDGEFDLICARLVLSHLPERETILGRLTRLLAPGGVILTEDWAPLRSSQDVVVAAPDPQAAQLYGQYQHTLGVEVFEQAGLDRTWARRVHPLLLADGLVDVHTEIHASYWTNGDAGCRMVAAVLNLVRPRLREYFSDDDLESVRNLLHSPSMIIHGHPMYATSGRRRPADQ